MGTSTSLSATSITVDPGSDAVIDLRVRNTGEVVDRFDFSALGDAAGWISVEPASISLLPDTEEQVHVVFHPPRASSTAAGVRPFAIKITSHEDPDGSHVDEGTVEVTPFAERGAELMPRMSRGRRTGRHRLALDNKGNSTADLRVSAIDPEDALTISLDPPRATVAPGTAQLIKARVRPRRRFWRGQPQTHPFQIVIEEDGREPITESASMLQEPLLPPWLWKALAAVVALAVAAIVLWQALLKPTVRTAARDAVAQPVAEAKQAAAVAQRAAAGGAAAGGAAPAGGAPGAATTPQAQASTPTTITPYGDAIDFRLSGAKSSFNVPKDQLLSLTDVVYQNPAGDSGTVEVLRNNDVLFSSALDNFRDLDNHFVSPYLFKGGDSVKLRITCKAPGPGNSACTTAASFSGFVRKG